MTIFRPIAAFITGFTAGIAEIIFGKKEEIDNINIKHCVHCDEEHTLSFKHTFKDRIKSGLHFAFIQLLIDISRWFLIGVIIAGVITYAVPANIVSKYLGSGWLSMFIMLAVGLPLYVCATASTPIAAALILKGMSPGAALVFLLVGPATNAASFTVITKILGFRTAFIYLISIAICAVILGMFLNHLYAFYKIDLVASVGHAHEMIPRWLKWITAVPLTTVMILTALKRRNYPNDTIKAK